MTTDIGTDDLATLYRQNMDMRADILAVLERIEGMLNPDQIDHIEKSQTWTHEQISKVSEALSMLVIESGNMGNSVVAIESMSEGASIAISKMADNVNNTRMDIVAMTSQLATFENWFKPVLDDFRESAVIPTMSKILGKTDELLASHENILGVITKIQEQVNPIIEKLMQSPVLRMLGVKND